MDRYYPKSVIFWTYMQDKEKCHTLTMNCMVISVFNKMLGMLKGGDKIIITLSSQEPLQKICWTGKYMADLQYFFPNVL